MGKGLALFSLFAFSLTAFAQDVTPQGSLTSKMGLDQRYSSQVPLSATFKTQDGKDVTMRDMLQGRPVVLLCMFFGCNGVCRLEVESLFKTLEKDKNLRPGRDFELVLLSIKPTETPAMAKDKIQQILQAYRVPSGTDGVTGLVGDLKNIRSVTDSVGFRYSYDPETELINHPAGLIFLDKNGVVRGYMYGAQFPTDVLAKNVEAAGKEIQGVKPELILLGCVMVDPVTGKKTIVIERLMMVLGTMTALTLAGSIFYMSKKYRVSGASEV